MKDLYNKSKNNGKMKIVIMDSSSIISLAMNNLLYLLERMKKSDVRFIIPDDVKREVVENPIHIKRYELEALVIRQIIKQGILEAPEAIDISSNEVDSERKRFMDIANHTFKAQDEWVRIVSNGEIACLALAEILRGKGISSVIMVDERTTRMLCEKPENLRKLFESKLHTKIYAETGNFRFFSEFRIIRSSELCYIAYKKGLIGIADGKQLIDALLYAVKFKGCAISGKEIEFLKKIG